MKRFILLIFLFSCQNKQQTTNAIYNKVDTLRINEQSSIHKTDTTKLQELFVDSLNIGKRHLNKIEIAKYLTGDSNYAIIKFYSKLKNGWILKNKFEFEKDDITGLETKVLDFNNDGFDDVTCISRVGARSANEIRRLYIYKKQEDKLILIKNSEDYPNMQYNKELNCIDAILIYGGCSTVFLNIKGDSLKEFASVELRDGLTIKTYDRNGKEKTIFRDTTNRTYFTRYRNFRPLKEYNDK